MSEGEEAPLTRQQLESRRERLYKELDGLVTHLSSASADANRKWTHQQAYKFEAEALGRAVERKQAEIARVDEQIRVAIVNERL
jgi:NAD-dependent DNA ligase